MPDVAEDEGKNDAAEELAADTSGKNVSTDIFYQLLLPSVLR